MRKTVIALITLASLGAAGAGGGAVMTSLLYNKTGKQLVAKVGRIVEQQTGYQGFQGNASSWQPGPGYSGVVSQSAGGFTLPTRVVPGAPGSGIAFYVSEIGGRILAVSESGDSQEVIAGLVNFPRETHLTEAGLLGLDLAPDGTALFAAYSYWNPDEVAYFNRVERLDLTQSRNGVRARTVILDTAPEMGIPSYQINFVVVSPDGNSLFAGIGSGPNTLDCIDVDKFNGKVLRMTLAGEPHPDNPFNNPEASRAAKYVFAKGFRNPHSMAFSSNGQGFVSDVGPSIDRIVAVEPGADYGFNSSDEQMRIGAAYMWGPDVTGDEAFCPVGLEVLPGAMMGVEAPEVLCVALFGTVYTPVAGTGNRIVAIELDGAGHINGAAKDLLTYTGNRFATPLDIARVGDSLAFVDFYGEGVAPHVGTARVYSLRFNQDRDDQRPEDASRAMEASPGGALFLANQCTGCHSMDPTIRTVGPHLHQLQARLIARLDSPEYMDRLREYTKRSENFYKVRTPEYESILHADDAVRAKVWLKTKLTRPRFDNPTSNKMPSFGHLSEQDLDMLVDWLIEQ